MGIEHRDYYRNSSRSTHRPSGFADMPVVCKRLLIGTVVVFLLQIFVTRPAEVRDIGDQMQLIGADIEDVAQEMPEEYMREQMRMMMPRVSVIQDWFELDPEKIKHGQIWRLLTYAFCHDRYGIWHLLVNMLFLYWFGTRLEQMYGSTEFLLFYCASAIVAGIAYLALNYYTGSSASVIGASGAVWGLVALYVIHYPYERIFIYGVFPVEIRWMALLYLVFDLHPVLLAINGEGMIAGGGVAHAAHLGGAAFGFLYFYRSWRLKPIADRLTGKSKNVKWQTRTVHRPPRDIVPMPRPDFPAKNHAKNHASNPADPKRKRLEAQLDQVLEKIQSEGRESLTDDEVQILEEASRQLRER
ncbi:MAG: rhomboid family intramembrane serine protease [Planctomycetales bacterium]|nr:rhomboid family intramembrane serine protease [Planctomycetales bacterium]